MKSRAVLGHPEAFLPFGPPFCGETLSLWKGRRLQVVPPLIGRAVIRGHAAVGRAPQKLAAYSASERGFGAGRVMPRSGFPPGIIAAA